MRIDEREHVMEQLKKIREFYDELLWNRCEDLEKHRDGINTEEFIKRERELEREASFLKKKLGIRIDGETYLCRECKNHINFGKRANFQSMYQILEFENCLQHGGLACL